MSGLNNKSGNLRGVTSQHTEGVEDGDNDWTDALPVQGWVVWSREKPAFNLNFDVGDHRVEVLLSANALTRMLSAIGQEQEADSGCNALYCTCNEKNSVDIAGV